MTLRGFLVIAAVWAAGLALPAPAASQAGAGTLAGSVRDASGAPLPGALVRVVNAATGVAHETVSNAEGLYRVAALVPGVYRVEIDLAGFDRTVRQPVALEVSQTLALDVVLGIARQSETVTVAGDTPRGLDSQSSSIAQTVTRQMLDALPLPNRAASSLAALAPGVVMVDTGGGTAENYPVFSVAGGRTRNQHFTLDGGNASNAVGLTRPQQLTSLPVDAMQEFKVITSNYAAEFGHSTGGVVVMSTRSGTSRFRGTLFESFRHDRLDARNFFAGVRPPVRLHQFGATAGGPLLPGRSFFFSSWERTRQRTADLVVSTVPTLGNRTGDFSDLRTSAGRPVQVYDPVTRLPFEGNRIPSERLDPVALAALE